MEAGRWSDKIQPEKVGQIHWFFSFWRTMQVRRAINPCSGGLESTGGEIRSGEVSQVEG